MEELLLQAELRQEVGKVKVKKIKTAGYLPAVIYAAGKQSVNIKVSRSELIKFIHQHKGVENALITLAIKDEKSKANHPCMIREIQHDPVKGEILHVDFNEISLTKTIKVKIPFAVKGESIGVKNDGGSLEHIMWDVEIECLPMDIPKHIEVDVSHLKIGDTIHIKDISFPAKVKVLADKDAIVFTVASPMKEEVAVEGEETDTKKEPEAIKEKKETAEEKAAADKGKDKK